MEIFFGSDVRARDGSLLGAVRLIVIDTQTLELTHLGVGASRDTDLSRLVPLTLVQEAREAAIDLRIDGDLQQFPVYLPGISVATEPTELAIGSSPVPRQTTDQSQTRAVALRRTSVVLDARCKVEALDGPMGNLSAVHLDLYKNSLDSILVGATSGQGRYDVPAKWFSAIRPGSIVLATTSKDAGEIIGPEAGPYLSVEGPVQEGDESYGR